MVSGGCGWLEEALWLVVDGWGKKGGGVVEHLWMVGVDLRLGGCRLLWVVI